MKRVLLAKLTLEYFAIGISRQALAPHHTADTLLLPHPRIGPFEQFGLEQRPSGMQHDHGQRGFTPALARQADHRGLGYRRMLTYDDLDIGRKDILAAGDDHVLLSVHDVKEPFFIQTTEVAGAQPLVA